MRLDKLDSISEWVGSKRPIETANGLGIVFYFAARSRSYRNEVGEVADEKCRMCFLGRTKFRLDAKVQLQRATLKPGTPTSSKIWRLGHFR